MVIFYIKDGIDSEEAISETNLGCPTKLECCSMSISYLEAMYMNEASEYLGHDLNKNHSSPLVCTWQVA